MLYVACLPIAVCLLLAGCRYEDNRAGEADSGERKLDSLCHKWSAQLAGKQYDSLSASARTYLYEAAAGSDTLGMVRAALYISSTYLHRRESDSVLYYLEKYFPREAEIKYPLFGAEKYNQLASLSLKTDSDYSKAMEYMIEGLKLAELSLNYDRMILILFNIELIFYIRSDKNGMDYAEYAVDLAEKHEVSQMSRCFAKLSLGQMKYVNGDFKTAYDLACESERIADAEGLDHLKSTILLLKADCCLAMGQYYMAEKVYELSMVSSSLSDPITNIICFNYAGCLLRIGRAEEALALCERGLELSYQYGNQEFRSIMLERLPDFYEASGDTQAAFRALWHFRSYLDSISNKQQEQRFSDLVMSYRQQEYEFRIRGQELDLTKARMRTAVYAGIVILIGIAFTVLLVLWSSQRRKYRELVARHQDYMRRLQSVESELSRTDAMKPDTSGGGNGSGEELLFGRIEALMRHDKIYHLKDLSVEKLSELLESNRTYVSKAINTCAGVPFYTYVDHYRIREATERLSAPGFNEPIKKLADDLGYNSVEVFYRAFRKETGCAPRQYLDGLRSIRKDDAA